MNAAMDMDDPALTAWLAAARAVHFACCLLIAGVIAFDRLALVGPLPGWRRAAVMLLLIATPTAFVSGAAWFVLVAANMSDLHFGQVLRSPEILRLVWSHTRFGHAWQIHFAFWLAEVIGAGVFAIGGFAAGWRSRWIGCLASAGLVGSLAWAGHGSTGPLPVWHLSVDVIHLLISSVWPMGLLPFAITLRLLLKSDDLDRWKLAAAIANRFSLCSVAAVALLLVSGLFNTWCLAGSIAALFDTRYGLILFLKVCLFFGMVGIGTYNRLRLVPKLDRLAAVGSTGAQPLLNDSPQGQHGRAINRNQTETALDAGEVSARHLWRNVIIELVLTAGVLAAVGLLGMLEPARGG